MFDRALAEAVLQMNTGNRRVNRRKIEQLARQMASGEFENTGEPIIMSAEGVINNGQHRLMAVVEADAVLDMDVRFGIPRKAFSKTDTGTSRTSGDVLTIKGVSGGGQVASAVRLLILYKRGLPGSIREFVSNDEVATAFDHWTGIADVVAAVNRHAFPKAVRSTPLYATAYLASRTPAKGKLEGVAGRGRHRAGGRPGEPSLPASRAANARHRCRHRNAGGTARAVRADAEELEPVGEGSHDSDEAVQVERHRQQGRGFPDSGGRAALMARP